MYVHVYGDYRKTENVNAQKFFTLTSPCLDHFSRSELPDLLSPYNVISLGILRFGQGSLLRAHGSIAKYLTRVAPPPGHFCGSY